LLKLLSSPDVSEKPAVSKTYFFLTKKSDQRKLLLWFGKIVFEARTCSVQLEIASINY